jgi:hypothetical protein
MEKIATPPHCPVDGIVLREAKIDGSWAKCDSEKEYLQWINEIRRKTVPLCLAQWEYEVWLRRRGFAARMGH